jgi:hypothetical protein
MKIQLFQSDSERLRLGVSGTYPDHLVEISKEKSESRHPINEQLTRPWMKHYFLSQLLRESTVQDDIIARGINLAEIFKTTIPLTDNSLIESTLSSWRIFLDNAFRDAEMPWYTGIKKILIRDRFYAAIEQLELEMPVSNTQRTYQFHDHNRTLRKIPRIPIKLLFALPGNEKAKLIEILRQAVNDNPHNIDVALLAYCFFKAWDRSSDFLKIARDGNRKELVEWHYWVENDMKSLGMMTRVGSDYAATFFIYDHAVLAAAENKEIADWFLKESEFKSAYHFYFKAKEFETALDLLQNISTKEFAALTNLRRISSGEKPFDTNNDLSRFNGLYQEEMETLCGFARIRAAETYKQVAAKARQNFDRETIETKYAFGELSEDEYHRLIKQLQERMQ